MNILVRKAEAKRISENGVSTFNEYDLPFNKFSLGVSEINGRYPQTGFDVDTEIEAIWYVESGNGEIYLMEQIYNIEVGDMIMIPKGEKFWINGNNLKLVVASSPLWYPEQHKHID